MKQLYGICALIARIRIREVLPDITEGGCTEQCIHDGVHDDIRITVAVETTLIRDGHAAEDQCTSLDQFMYIISCSDSHKNLHLRCLETDRLHRGLPSEAAMKRAEVLRTLPTGGSFKRT